LSQGGEGYSLCLKPHYAWVQNLFRLIPGARGYLAREKLREADILIRRHVASKLDEAARNVDQARQLLASLATQAAAAMTPMLSQFPAPVSPQGTAVLQALPVVSEKLRGLYSSLQVLSDDIAFADAGWAPVGAVQAIREDEIRKLCEYDDTMLGLAEQILRLSRSLLDAAARSDTGEVLSLAGQLEEAVSSLRALYDERREFLRFATTQKGPEAAARAAAAKAKEALGAALEKARTLLRRLTGRA